ncbi:MAG: SUMF1/EgtB/PvdO family nonheme iron enzyme, partial [Kiloniellales bacterium]
MALPARLAAADVPIVVPELVSIPAGPFIVGSDLAERELAYQLDEAAYGHSRTRRAQWYENEDPAETIVTPAFEITRTPITNRQYAAFVAETGYPSPDVEWAVWQSYGLVHPFGRTRRHAWSDGRPPAGRADHPVVLVSQDDAAAYADWLSGKTGRRWSLPSEIEWEKAARGLDGRSFPWGSEW